jgi:hypothetical protein
MLRDIQNMQNEDVASSAYRDAQAAMAMQTAWEAEHSECVQMDAMNSAMLEIDARKTYMNSFFDCPSSEFVMGFKWSQDPREMYWLNRNIPTFDDNNQDRTLDVSGENMLGKTTFHQEGLQQARALQTASASPSQQSQSQFQSQSQSQASVMNKTQSRSTYKLAENLFSSNEMCKKTILLMDSQKYAEQVLCGHTTHFWDQEAILRDVFMMLDRSRLAYLTPMDISRLTDLDAAQELLRYSIYGPWVKRKKWETLLRIMFSRSAASGGRLTLDTLLDITASLCTEKNKSIQKIKTDEEYRKDVQMEYLMSGDNLGYKFAMDERMERFSNERDYHVKSTLHEGDVIWALYLDGCMWMPAVIIAVNEDSSYDLKYPFTQWELREARKTAQANRILRGPNRDLEEKEKNRDCDLVYQQALLKSIREFSPQCEQLYNSHALPNDDPRVVSAFNQILRYNFSTKLDVSS